MYELLSSISLALILLLAVYLGFHLGRKTRPIIFDEYEEEMEAVKKQLNKRKKKANKLKDQVISPSKKAEEALILEGIEKDE